VRQGRYQVVKWQASLANWRSVRNIIDPQDNYVDMMSGSEGEISEFILATETDDWHEQVDAICDMLVLTTNQIATEKSVPGDGDIVQFETIPSIEGILTMYQFGSDNANVLYPITKFCNFKLTDLGVIPDLAMKQTLKEISSRKIDPAKEADWNAGKLDKWPKDPNQDPSTLYKANYNLCRTKQL
jgi:hypothetical protein